MSKQTLQHYLAQAIRARRESLGISQETFADKIEMHRAYYGAIERGHKNLTLRMIERLAKGLSARPADLFVEAQRYDSSAAARKEAAKRPARAVIRPKKPKVRR